MIKLKKVTIHKYKSIEEPQTVELEDKITTLVGLNESGKTAFLEAIAKTHYFNRDPKFRFNATLDYPRKEKRKFDKSAEVPIAVTSIYMLSTELFKKIQQEVGDEVFTTKYFEYVSRWNNSSSFNNIECDIDSFAKYILEKEEIYDEELQSKLAEINNLYSLEKLAETIDDSKVKSYVKSLKKYFENKGNWQNPITEYVVRVWVKPHMPKFLYYDEYYSLPSRIDISQLLEDDIEDEALKTSKALFELAEIDVNDLHDTSDFEDYIAELETTSEEITAMLLKFWSGNPHLRVRFVLDKEIADNEIYPVLDIRIENIQKKITLPLKNRSKGFNWFFSFIIWFSKIQKDKNSSYILLLDEPALNLHASAQADFLKFIELLSNDYQIVFTTHSPFMVKSGQLQRVRTVVDSEAGTLIKDYALEHDEDTIFPLQASMGFDVAQNMFAPNNLLVEQPGDLLYLTIMSSILQQENRTGLKEGISIIPVGGLQKVISFVSLVNSKEVNLVCLLNSINEELGFGKLNKVKHQLLKERNIRFYNEFTLMGAEHATIEDLFRKEEYLKLYNLAFEREYIEVHRLDTSVQGIIPQINKVIGKNGFNNYQVANKLAQLAVGKDFFSDTTLDRFEKLFMEINKYFNIQSKEKNKAESLVNSLHQFE